MPRSQDAPRLWGQKPLILATAQANLGDAAAAGRARRLFGPMENTARQDVLAAADTEDKAKATSDDDHVAAWNTYR